jgi:phosphopantetheine--protein transferase-like protein
MHIGIDIVNVNRLKPLMADKNALAKVFNPRETSDNPLRLAGWLAAKEAYFKACGAKSDWLDLAVGHDEYGAPYLLIKSERNNRIKLSISHDGEYAMAVAIIDE